MMILKTSRSNLSSNDQLALDLPFAATKSIAARVGPTPVFTRGSGATYIGSDGLIHGVDTSTTSNTIGTGSRTFTLAATAGQDQFWRAGDAVEASNGSNSMVGTVTSYNAATQSLVCNMISTGGSGTFTSWRIGYRGPRFDHTSAGVCRGLLIEESRTNLFQYSEIFNEAASSNYWDSATANAVTSNQTTSPDGAATADLLTTSTTSFDCFVRRTINWAGSTQYSYSIFLKRGPSNHRYVGLYIGAGITGALQYPYFDFDNPTTVQIPSGTMVGTINSTRVDAYPNGWYRVSVTFTTAATPVTSFGGVYVSTSNGTLSSTPTAGLDCYIWGAQLEAGSFPTSYIPTTTGTLVRNADVCSITGSDFTSFYNNDQGTMVTVASANGLNPSLINAVAGIESGATPVMRFFYRAAQGNRLSAQISGVISTPASNYNTANVVYKSAITAGATGADYVIDGTQIPDTYTGSVLTANNLKFTGMSGSASNTTISSFRYYSKRLPVSKLQALTA